MMSTLRMLHRRLSLTNTMHTHIRLIRIINVRPRDHPLLLP